MSIAIGTLAMLVGNVGLQVLNNWCNSRQNNELQLKREEFERAARNHQTERMWQILREGQAITLELEQSRQKQRIEELESEMEKLLKSLAYQKTIENWPLSVLPIVMKNQALGNLLAHQNESFAMHCILTPSNNPSFNKHVFSYVEQSLENYCNQYWSIDGSHPVLFYGGAWASSDAPTQTQISSMQAALSNLPTMLITPFFRPGEGRLIFQVRMWGIGATSDNKDFEDTWEIEPTDFQHEYSVCSDYDKEEHLLDDAINDIVPYLQCLIGYMADTYFWSVRGIVPLLPALSVSNNDLKYIDISRSYYDKLMMISPTNDPTFFFSIQQKIRLLSGVYVLQNKEDTMRQFDEIILSYCNYCSSQHFDILENVLHYIKNHKNEIPLYHLTKAIYEVLGNNEIPKLLSKSANELLNSSLEIIAEGYELFELERCDIDDILSFADRKKEHAINADSFVFIIWNKDLIIGTFCANQEPCVYMKDNTMRYFIFRCNEASFDCTWNRYYYKYNTTNKKMSKMDKSFEEKFGQRFEKVGRGLGKMFDAVTIPHMSGEDSIWKDSPGSTTDADSTQKIVSFFIANAGKSVAAQRVDNMALQTIFDWVDKNASPFMDKVFIIKGYNDNAQKHVFCVFFGSGDRIYIKENDPCICFITDTFNDEMKQTFNNNNICEIPLK